ncbi:MAG: ketol-acid reductoisomerase [Phycisphaerae bacterium]|nr:ketol-acid reductoisomerase [Phycisphaerae bacterium]
MLTNLANSASFEPLRERPVAVIGCGTQGVSHAANLRDSGARVCVAQRPGGSGERRARDAGFEPLSIGEAVRQSDLLIFGLPDDATPDIYAREIHPLLRPGHTLGFLHGFVVHYGLIEIPAAVDVILCAPKGQGRAVRSEFVAGGGVGALIAVHQDASGRARQTALAWAAGIGSHRTAIFETTFRDETETDLFGEQAVLCGGVSSLVRAAFDTLVNAGYPPELAYLECCHELKLVADLIYAEGIAGMRARISSTARYGDLTRGPRVIGAATQAAMDEILSEIRSGAFAREFIKASRESALRDSANAASASAHADDFERVGRGLRELLLRRRVE